MSLVQYYGDSSIRISLGIVFSHHDIMLATYCAYGIIGGTLPNGDCMGHLINFLYELDAGGEEKQYT